MLWRKLTGGAPGRDVRALAHPRLALMVGLGLGLAGGCETLDFGLEEEAPGARTTTQERAPARPEPIDTSNLFGGQVDEEGAKIGVNTFLWRASLDTLAFLPLASADPFGGVIITDWYSPPEAPDERFKVTAYILDRTLRADGIRISVFRQVREGPGNWVDAPVADKIGVDLENTILTRARQLRIRTSPG